MTTFWVAAGWTGSATMRGSEIVVADDGTIASIEPRPAPSSAASVLEGWLMPAFANAHSHVFHRALRGRTHQAGDFWEWRRRMYALAATLQPEAYERLAVAVYGEMARAGIAVVGEFHYLHRDPAGAPYADPNEMAHALVRAAKAAGLRISLLDTLYLSGGVDGSSLTPHQRRFSDGTFEEWAMRHELLTAAYEGDPDVVVGAAAHSVRAVPEPALRAMAEQSRGPVHVHLSEQARENADSIGALGRTPARVLSDAGLLGPLTTAVHATHLPAEDIELLAANGSGACLCPTTERDLGDGLGPAVELDAAGVGLSLGTDSHAMIDMFEEARAVELNDRARLQRRGIHDPERLLLAATQGGRVALGWPGGTLAPGAPADFLTVDIDTVRVAGAVEPAAVLFGAVAADVVSTFVGGAPVVSDRRHERLEPVEVLLHQVLREMP